MPIDIQPPCIRSEESPKDILAADFRSMDEIPIRGGWGYTIDAPVIIDKNDPIVPKGIPFDGVGLDYIFIEKRIYEEFIIFRPEDDRYSGIEWKSLKQELSSHSGSTYDVLTIEDTTLPVMVWEELKEEWEGP